jgi:hypothetical protein
MSSMPTVLQVSLQCRLTGRLEVARVRKFSV